MPSWYWYVANDKELFIDMDRDAVKHFFARFESAKNGPLKVARFRQQPSLTSGHRHIVIELCKEMPAIERYVWEIVLRSDVYRGCCNIMRELKGISAPDILITRTMFPDYRQPDDACFCPRKHDTQQMKLCPIAIKLRGAGIVKGFFGHRKETHENMPKV